MIEVSCIAGRFFTDWPTREALKTLIYKEILDGEIKIWRDSKQSKEIGYPYAKEYGFPCSSVGKESACNSGDEGLVPGLGRSSGEGNGNPLQYSCLENPKTEEPGKVQSMESQESDTT